MRSDEELGVWLRQQRESRSWARPEMARQLISAARRSGDTSMPGVDSVAHNIYRWERGANGLSDRYKLHYCRAFGISPDDFGSGQAERPVYQACGTSNDPPVLAFASGDGEGSRGLVIVGALTKEWPYFLLPSGGKVVYCFLEIIMTDSQARAMKSAGTVHVPDPDDAVRIASFFGIDIGWSVFWDKRHGVWRASEDDPSSDLYEEDADAQRVIAYVAAHS